MGSAPNIIFTAFITFIYGLLYLSASTTTAEAATALPGDLGTTTTWTTSTETRPTYTPPANWGDGPDKEETEDPSDETPGRVVSLEPF